MKGPRDFICGNLSFYGTILPSLVSIDLLKKDTTFLICNVISHDATSLKGWEPITVKDNLAMFCGHWSNGSGDITYLICHVNS